jgi:hypothetical protein
MGVGQRGSHLEMIGICDFGFVICDFAGAETVGEMNRDED